MIFATSSRLSKCDKKLTLYYDGRVIHTTETYKYLGTVLVDVQPTATECTKKQPPNFAGCTHYACTSKVLQKLR